MCVQNLIYKECEVLSTYYICKNESNAIYTNERSTQYTNYFTLSYDKSVFMNYLNLADIAHLQKFGSNYYFTRLINTIDCTEKSLHKYYLQSINSSDSALWPKWPLWMLTTHDMPLSCTRDPHPPARRANDISERMVNIFRAAAVTNYYFTYY